jgi:lipoprotein-anchoring transpeptidase ErfK/SrfK
MAEGASLVGRVNKRRVGLGIITVGLAGLMLAGCTSTTPSNNATTPNNGGSGGSASTGAMASLNITPAANGGDISPTTPIVVKATNGRVSTVTVKNAATGVVVNGSLSADKTIWTSTDPLGYGASYQVTATGAGADGKTTEQNSTVHTITPAEQTFPSLVPAPASGGDVGVGQVIEVMFDRSVTDRAAAEKALTVTSNPPQPGGWYWISNKEVHYRPRSYWQPGTTITVNIGIYGVNLGGGLYGQTDRTMTLHVHDAWVARADGGTEQMQIFHNGQLVNTMPISLGSPGHPSHEGPHVISQKSPTVVMDSCTYGVCAGQPGYYKETVYLDERISNDGEFVHAAPWSVGSQGSSNVSHGCVNLSPANAQWFYDHFSPGDVVEITNSGGPTLPVWDTYGDWELSWAQWQAGSALHQ